MHFKFVLSLNLDFILRRIHFNDRGYKIPPQRTSVRSAHHVVNLT